MSGTETEIDADGGDSVSIAGGNELHDVPLAGGWPTEGFDNASIGLAVIDAEGRHTVCNPAYAEFAGRTTRAVVGTSITDLVSDDDVARLKDWLHEPTTPLDLPVRVKRTDGEFLDAMLFVNPVDSRPAGRSMVQLVPFDSSPSVRELNARFRAITENTNELVVMTRGDGTVTLVSPSFLAATGLDPEDVRGTRFGELIHPDDSKVIAQASRTSRTPVLEVELRFRAGGDSGETRWIPTLCRVTEVRDQTGNLIGLAHLARPVGPVGGAASSDETPVDPAERRPAPAAEAPASSESAVAEPPTRDRQGPLPAGTGVSPRSGSGPMPLDEVIHSTTDIVWMFDHDGPVFANAAARRTIGLGDDESLDGIGLGDIHPRWAVERIARQGIPDTLEGRTWQADLAVIDTEGEERPVSYVLMAHHGPDGAISYWSSISRPEGPDAPTEADLRWAATHDPLTGLPGKVLIHDRIEVALARSTRTGQRVGLLLLDLDFFEVVNTSVGPDIADRILQSLAERLQSSIRPGDTIGRMGEDEFVVLCEHFDRLDDAEQFANRLLRVVDDPFPIDGAEWFVSVSIGIALARPSLTTPSSLLRNAEQAMYRAKELGRGRQVVFGNSLRTPGLPFPGDPG